MFDESVRHDPLLQAIAEFRDGFDRLIDEEKARWSLSAPEAEAPEPAALEPRGERHIRPEVQEALNDAKGKKRTKVVVHPPARVAVAAPAALAAVAAPAESARPAGAADPRQRLDVLAKHLDRRARQSCAADPDADRQPAEAVEH